ncbi:MAG: SPASM domain-containing protein [Clostridia bacterium]|nr:SPASM domain-containing protein [Clostridia bacterium]
MKASRFNLYISENGQYCVTNTMTGATAILTEKEWDALQRNNTAFFTQEDRELLNEQGFLVDDNIDEIKLLEKAYFTYKANDETINLTICPTLDCNFDCPYCYEQRKPGRMDEDTQRHLIVFVEALLKSHTKKLCVTWYGGEPLLCMDVIERVTLALKDLCANYKVQLKLSMITNGFLLNVKNGEMLKKLGFSGFQITLDGLEKTHNARRYLKNGDGTFQKVYQGILEASKFATVAVRVNVDRVNVGEFERVMELFNNSPNVECYCAPVTVENTQSDEVARRCFGHHEYHKFYNKWFEKTDWPVVCGVSCCAAEKENTFVIDPDGNLYKCLNDLGNPKWKMGSVLGQNYGNAGVVKEKYLDRNPFCESECKDCLFLPQCYGGCVWEYMDKGSHGCRSVKYVLIERIKRKFLRKE